MEKVTKCFLCGDKLIGDIRIPGYHNDCVELNREWYEKKIGNEWYGFRPYQHGAFVCLIGGGFDYAYKQGDMTFESFMEEFEPSVDGSMPAMVGDWIQIDLF